MNCCSYDLSCQTVYVLFFSILHLERASFLGPQSQTSGGNACRTSQNGGSAVSVRDFSVHRAAPANLCLFRNKLAPYQKTDLTEEQAEDMPELLDNFDTTAALLLRVFKDSNGEGVERSWAALQLPKVFPHLLFESFAHPDNLRSSFDSMC
jgi:hypothetical protein